MSPRYRSAASVTPVTNPSRRAARRRAAGLAATIVAVAATPAVAAAQGDALPARDADAAAARTPWYESFSIRGYAQVRYNRLLETNERLQCEQCDRSWGENGGISIRRARVIISGQIHPRIFIYFQPDFASSVGSTQLVAQMRDWYMDVGLNATNTWRVRLGQSKIPYSFEAMQSSSNRIPLDRADGTNSAHVNERDLGAFVYWAPRHIRSRFKAMVDSGYKGSGDYGALAFGVYNGQGAGRAEANDGLTAVARATWPFQVNRRTVIEPSIAAFKGRYVLTSDLRSAGLRGPADWQFADERVLGTIALQARPFGLLAEYNVGRGPQYDPTRDSVITKRLSGGFVTANWVIERKGQQYLPFVRWQAYDGGKKHERDARAHRVRDVEVGVEWQASRNFELVVAYHFGDRITADRTGGVNPQRGRLLRLQAQVNY